MLLNLSNHKSSAWPQAQMDTAVHLYDGVQDMDFPQIDPEASAAEVSQLSMQYLEAIEGIALLYKYCFAVHLMGEMTFCFALCTLLKAKGISVVASTTNRVGMEKDGVKTSTFQFVQFREY